MAKDDYHLAGNPKRWQDDSSCKSCTCIMISILVISLLIILIPWEAVIKRGKGEHTSETLHGKYEHNKSKSTNESSSFYDKTEGSSRSLETTTEGTVMSHRMMSVEHQKSTKKESETTAEDRLTTLKDHGRHSELTTTEESLVTFDSSKELSTDLPTTPITEAHIVDYSDSTSVEVTTNSDFSKESATHESVVPITPIFKSDE